MAAYFFDASAIVKRYVQEIGTGWVESITEPSGANIIYLARISAVEVTSAIVRRQRSGTFIATRATVILPQFRQDFVQEYRVVEITPALLAVAEHHAEVHFLRANDAIQLAAVAELQRQRLANGLDPVTLVSADQELNAAARSLGLPVEDPNLHP